MNKIIYLAVAILIFLSLILIYESEVLKEKSLSGYFNARRIIRKTGKKYEIWDRPMPKYMVQKISGLIPEMSSETAQMYRNVERAMPEISYKEYMARQYIRLFFGIFGLLFLWILNLKLPALLCASFFIMSYLRQKETLERKLKEKNAAVASEMPDFVRSICTSLKGNRDVYAVIESYRKTAGKELGDELDILLASMKSGSTEKALWDFKNRIGSDDASRLCSILIEYDKGIDQSAALEYLAMDMTARKKIEKEKELDMRPARLRRTYIPTVGISVVTVMYVLIIFVMGQVSNLY